MMRRVPRLALKQRRCVLSCRGLSSVARQPNQVYAPGVPVQPVKPSHSDEQGVESLDVDAFLRRHGELHTTEWSAADVSEATDRHSVFTWGASGAMKNAALQVVQGDGVYFHTADGQKWLDFNSQAMCLSMGHTPPDSVVEAVAHQLRTLAYAYPGMSIVSVRARLCALLAELCPGDINAFMFPGSGAEANEAAMRMARLATGRNKIMARHRSYHGGTNATMMLGGDLRKWPVQHTGGVPGVSHFFDPYPYSFSWGATEEEITKMSLQQLREQLAYEGPKNVAAIFLESFTGTNGILKPPRGYLEGIRALCDEHGILMICDEVMSGFGRTGKLFGFMHAPGVIPDMITFAKGVNGAFIPMGGVGVREHLREHFRNSPVGYGSTYNGHPVALASAYAALRESVAQGLVANAAAMETHMVSGMQMLMDRHPSVKQARAFGLFGCLDIQKNTRGDFIAEVHDPPAPAMLAFKKALFGRGLFHMMRGHHVFCNPPLIIKPEQLQEGFAILDECLPILDEAMEN